MLLKQAKLHHSLSNKLLFNHIILRKKNFNCNCGRNKSFPNQVLFALGMGRGVDATLTNLFNPTLGRDASHPCLISTWPKEGCIIVCVYRASLKNCCRICIGRGVPFEVTNLCGLHPKQTIPMMGTALKSAFLWEERIFP